MITKEEALRYHSEGRSGKIEVSATKPCITQKDLSLAYTPGVAEPCREIERDKSLVYDYTAKGNLVAVISNGTAVLGLGDIGPEAGKPVMEGKGVLFKRFADIDVFDLELDAKDPEEIIQVVKLLEPTFGGINLEDIKAPECFEIETRLQKIMSIPVFHDDQHGTAIISGAALLNALEVVDKDISKIKIVFSGAGAAGIACARYFISLGVSRKNLILCDSSGVVYKGRTERMNPQKEELAADTKARTLAEALKGADAFAGLSVADLLTKDMVRSMARNPIILAMANPDPEISYEDALEARDDVIIATGRSDYPNQVNNVLGFPFIFRGALDVRATAINETMKHAATKALANLAKENVPYSVMKAYRLPRLEFGREYIIPKPFDPRVLLWVAPAVAGAAMKTGVAQKNIDLDKYKEELEARLGLSRKFMRNIINIAKKHPKRVVYPRGDADAVLRASDIVLDEGLATPILIGKEEEINARVEELRLRLHGGVEIIDPQTFPKKDKYIHELYELRKRKGMSRYAAEQFIEENRNYFACMMVRMGDADGMVSGVTQHYPEAIRPALQVIGVRPGVRKVASMYALIFEEQIYFFADTSVNVETTAEDIAEIALLVAAEVEHYGIEPRVAMLSFSNFGSAKHPQVSKMREATHLVHEKRPDLQVDGEMQADTAVAPEIIRDFYPFCKLKNGANVLIFPDLQSSNIAYKLVQHLGKAEALGPILLGMNKPVHLLQIGSNNEVDIVNMTALAVLDVQRFTKK